jgi:hypothetical protein
MDNQIKAALVLGAMIAAAIIIAAGLRTYFSPFRTHPARTTSRSGSTLPVIKPFDFSRSINPTTISYLNCGLPFFREFVPSVFTASPMDGREER